MSGWAVVLAALFVQPLNLPHGARLWMMLPLVACVAAVYRASRARHPREMPKATVLTFVNIVIGMMAIAVGFYLVHLAVQRFL
jgi:hypothetical protein